MNVSMNVVVLVITLCVSLRICLVIAQYQPTWDSLNSRPLPKWYDQSKFGIFLHWGVYSVPCLVSEWFWDDWKVRNITTIIKYMEKNYPPGFEYSDFAPKFRAELFDSKAWVELFQKAGARCVACGVCMHVLLDVSCVVVLLLIVVCTTVNIF